MAQDSTPQALLTLREVADILQLDVATVRRYVRSGDLPASNVSAGRLPIYRVRKSALDRWLRSRRAS
jgi:excisionase family DNA binding protein